MMYRHASRSFRLFLPAASLMLVGALVLPGCDNATEPTGALDAPETQTQTPPAAPATPEDQAPAPAPATPETQGPQTHTPPAPATSSIDQAEAQVTPYPLDVCIVSGEALGSMGDPIVRVHEGQEVKFCCAACVPEFEKDPAKYLAKLDQPAEMDAHEGHDHGDHDHAH